MIHALTLALFLTWGLVLVLAVAWTLYASYRDARDERELLTHTIDSPLTDEIEPRCAVYPISFAPSVRARTRRDIDGAA